jgi:hypothetical protein
MEEPAPKKPRSRAWRPAVFIVVTLVVCGILLPSALMLVAKNRVERFCQQIEVGQKFAGLEASAKEAGLEVRHRPPLPRTEGQSVPGRMTAWDGWMYARWFCDIKYQDDEVVSKEVFFLD